MVKELKLINDFNNFNMKILVFYIILVITYLL